VKFKDFDGEYEVESVDLFPGAQKDDARSRTTFTTVGRNECTTSQTTKLKEATKTILPAVVFAANHQCIAAADIMFFDKKTKSCPNSGL
jgi:hypothetical protein